MQWGLNAYALDYMRTMLHDTEYFGELTEQDQVAVLMIIDDALRYYFEGCDKEQILNMNGNNGIQ